MDNEVPENKTPTQPVKPQQIPNTEVEKTPEGTLVEGIEALKKDEETGNDDARNDFASKLKRLNYYK